MLFGLSFIDLFFDCLLDGREVQEECSRECFSFPSVSEIHLVFRYYHCGFVVSPGYSRDLGLNQE